MRHLFENHDLETDGVRAVRRHHRRPARHGRAERGRERDGARLLAAHHLRGRDQRARERLHRRLQRASSTRSRRPRAAYYRHDDLEIRTEGLEDDPHEFPNGHSHVRAGAALVVVADDPDRRRPAACSAASRRSSSASSTARERARCSSRSSGSEWARRSRAGRPVRAAAVLRQARARTSRSRSRLLPPRAAPATCVAIYGFARLVDELGDEYAGDRARRARRARGRARPRLRRRAPRHPVLRALPADGPRVRHPARAVRPADRGEPAGPGASALRDLRGARRLLRPVGEPGRRARAARASARRRPSGSRCRTTSARRCSWSSTGRTSARTSRRGRVYLPLEDLQQLRRRRGRPRRQAHAGGAARARRLRGRAGARRCSTTALPLVARSRGRARLAVAGYVGGGRAALDAIERAGYDVLPVGAAGDAAEQLTRDAARAAAVGARDE